MEALYQRALSASSSLGIGLEKILREEVLLEGDQKKDKGNKEKEKFKVAICRSNIGGSLSMRKQSRNFFGTPASNLQRGYGPYTVEGEEDENALGPIKHLVFVVHGIGEAMWSREDVGVNGIVASTNEARALMHKRQMHAWREECKRATARKE